MENHWECSSESLGSISNDLRLFVQLAKIYFNVTLFNIESLHYKINSSVWIEIIGRPSECRFKSTSFIRRGVSYLANSFW